MRTTLFRGVLFLGAALATGGRAGAADFEVYVRDLASLDITKRRVNVEVFDAVTGRSLLSRSVNPNGDAIRVPDGDRARKVGMSLRFVFTSPDGDLEPVVLHGVLNDSIPPFILAGRVLVPARTQSLVVVMPKATVTPCPPVCTVPAPITYSPPCYERRRLFRR